MKNYGVLKGRAQKFTRDDDNSPHSEVLVIGVENHRIAINVRSSRGPEYQRLIEYLLLPNVDHPLLEFARTLDDGFTDLRGDTQHLHGVDYIRSNMFRAQDLVPIVHTKPGPDNDLFEKIESLLRRAIDTNATIYAYGEKWGPEPGKQDAYFRFLPGNGIHMIHMNQGDGDNPNGKYQDGALFIEFASGETAGLFLKFQNQAWHTDESGGNRIEDAPNNEPIIPPAEGDINPWEVVSPDSPYHLARIIGALVNPAGADEGKESVTIFNTSDKELDLSGWQIIDKNDKAESLDGILPFAQARTFTLSGRGAQLGNKGGTITLLDQRGLKVDGVAYTRKIASTKGKPVVF